MCSAPSVRCCPPLSWQQILPTIPYQRILAYCDVRNEARKQQDDVDLKERKRTEYASINHLLEPFGATPASKLHCSDSGRTHTRPAVDADAAVAVRRVSGRRCWLPCLH